MRVSLVRVLVDLGDSGIIVEDVTENQAVPSELLDQLSSSIAEVIEKYAASVS